jgi:hypothetical protein
VKVLARFSPASRPLLARYLLLAISPASRPKNLNSYNKINGEESHAELSSSSPSHATRTRQRPLCHHALVFQGEQSKL